MRKNYKISEHRIYHAWLKLADSMSAAARVMWKEFLRPELILTVGVGLSAPFAHIASRVIESIIW